MDTRLSGFIRRTFLIDINGHMLILPRTHDEGTNEGKLSHIRLKYNVVLQAVIPLLFCTCLWLCVCVRANPCMILH